MEAEIEVDDLLAEALVDSMLDGKTVILIPILLPAIAAELERRGHKTPLDARFVSWM